MIPEVYALLAQANLLRIRGSWQEAVDKCMAAMRLVPGNGAAQSLLGDIYENQGRIEEAIQWYRMALDTNPNSPADKQKLHRLTSIREQTSEGLHDEPTVNPPVDAALPDGALLKFNVLRATATICGVCVFALMLSAALHPSGRVSALSSRDSNKLTTANPVTLNDPSTDGAGSSTMAPRDPFEVGLSNSLSMADVPDEMRFTDVIADPRGGRLTLTYVIRPVVSIDRETVLRDALRAAESASKAPETVSYPYFTLRVLLSSDDLVTSPDSGSLIFIGDIGRTDLVDFPSDTSTVPLAQIQSAFTNQWWAPSLTPPPTSPSPPTPPALTTPEPAPASNWPPAGSAP